MAVQTASAYRGPAFVRIAVALQTLTLFFQAATAGLLLTSAHGELLQRLEQRRSLLGRPVLGQHRERCSPLAARCVHRVVAGRRDLDERGTPIGRID